ncbi:hypothetical protein [Asticcacaulis benevestitus]|uniref:Uncharacterized protein n=1 Tax=Asticcacaulis benevestitus DSM 16100 = ATCC BAA-896 TaxID=1121022 RepID=V4NTA5_9CAUL|nr:hypothetical protein [Asticcacaulis benevestitus]ESQ79146.1 hypothetical protein ABENE_22830 [Asticcacaulis benevestitus DSM 16100 = ATCC BAA-896]
MELLLIDDWATSKDLGAGQIEIDTKISEETAIALDLIDANIRAAEQQAGQILLA